MLYCRCMCWEERCQSMSTAHFWAESWALCPPRCSPNRGGFKLWGPEHHHRCVDDLWRSLSTQAVLQFYVFQCVFSSSSEDFVTAGEEQAEDVGEWGLYAQQWDNTTPISRFLKGNLPSLLQVLHMPTGGGRFLQLFMCLSLGCACRIQRGCPCAAPCGGEAQQWCWGMPRCFWKARPAPLKHPLLWG